MMTLDQYLAESAKAPPSTAPTQDVSCPCSVCGGRSARVRGTNPRTPTEIHNLVCMAHSPLSRANSARRFGPWPL